LFGNGRFRGNKNPYYNPFFHFLISHSVTEPEFRTFFSQFGELNEAIVMFDRDTKTSRGFGFVTYTDPVRAFRLETMTYDIRLIVLKVAMCDHRPIIS
jgi:hypothetical protein